jgi:predicted Zn-dependent protease
VIAWESGRPRQAAAFFHQTARALLAQELSPGLQARTVTWMLTLAATTYAAAGDTTAVLRLADSVEVLGPRSYFGRDAKLHHFLRGLVLQARGRHAEAVSALERSLFSLTDGYTRTNLELARCLLVLHRPEDAIRVLRPALRGGVDGSNTYVTHTELHEALAQAFDQAGQRDSAVAHYRLVEAAWRHADPEFAERYHRARANAGGP